MISVAFRLGAKFETRNASGYSKITEGVRCAAIRGNVKAEHRGRSLKAEAGKNKAEKTKIHSHEEDEEQKGPSNSKETHIKQQLWK